MRENGIENTKKANNVQHATRIFEKYGDFIWNIICWKGEDQDRFDDLYQEIFLQIAAKPLPEDIKNVKGYLYKIVCHRIIDSTRKTQTFRKKLKKYNSKYDLSINAGSVENDLIEEEQFNHMLELIGKELPSRHSQAIIMRYRDECSTGEIAKKMGVNTETVNHYVCVGLRKLRSILRIKR